MARTVATRSYPAQSGVWWAHVVHQLRGGGRVGGGRVGGCQRDGNHGREDFPQLQSAIVCRLLNYH